MNRSVILAAVSVISFASFAVPSSAQVRCSIPPDSGVTMVRTEAWPKNGVGDVSLRLEIRNQSAIDLAIGGKRIDDKFHTGYPELKLEVQERNGEWTGAAQYAPGSYLPFPDELIVKPGQSEVFIADLNFVPDQLLGFVDIKLPWTFRVVFYDNTGRVCVATKPFLLQ